MSYQRSFVSRVRNLTARSARGAFSLVLPKSKALSLEFWAGQVAGTMEPELLHLRGFCRCSRGQAAVDIGANKGFYTYALSKIYRHVYAFEPNDGVSWRIGAYNKGKVTLTQCALSSEGGEATLYIPYIGKRENSGWASLGVEHAQSANSGQMRSVCVPLRALDSFALEDISFIKIDVEGWELSVLEGAVSTIRKWRPTILIEVRSQNRAATDQYFAVLDYEGFQLHDIVKVKGSDDNVIYIPKEKVPAFAEGRS